MTSERSSDCREFNGLAGIVRARILFGTSERGTLTLQNGATNNYIVDTARLSYVTADTINLNYTGTETVAGLIVDGLSRANGIYGSGGTNPAHLQVTVSFRLLRFSRARCIDASRSRLSSRRTTSSPQKRAKSTITFSNCLFGNSGEAFIYRRD